MTPNTPTLDEERLVDEFINRWYLPEDSNETEIESRSAKAEMKRQMKAFISPHRVTSSNVDELREGLFRKAIKTSGGGGNNYELTFHMQDLLDLIHSHIQVVIEERDKKMKDDLTKMAHHYTDDELADGLDPWAVPLVSLAKYLKGEKE